MATQTELAVADLMTLEPIVVDERAFIEDAETLLRDHRISGLPVVDEDGILVGVFSQTDVLHLMQPHVRDLIRGRSSRLRVGEVMSRPPVTVHALAPLHIAAQVMMEHDVHRVVAVDTVGRPIGVLSAMDFVRLAAED